MKARAHIFISGVVQGVFYRVNTKRVAKQLGVRGWVRNLRDGRVEAVFEGEREQVENAVEWCRAGPPGARVTEVEVSWERYDGSYSTFEIIY